MTTPDNYIPNSGAESNLAAWSAGDLLGAIAHLYSNNVPFLPTNTPGSYVESSWPGYIPQPIITWTPPFINGQGKGEIDSNLLAFNLAAKSGSYLSYGMYLTDSTGAKLLLVMPFFEPRAFTPDDPNLFITVNITGVSEL